MTRNEVHEQIVNCHCRLRKRIHNSTVNKKAKAKKKDVVIWLPTVYDMLSTLTTIKRKDIIIE